MDHSNLGSSLAHVHVFSFAYNELDDIISSLESWDLKSNNTSHAVHLSHGVSVDRASQDVNLWSILRDKSSKLARLSQNDDKTDILLIENR